MTLYKTITIDPPWPAQGGGKIKRGANKHYPLLSVRRIPGVTQDSKAFTPDLAGCHLYLWTINSFLPHALVVMDLIGFRYVANRVWIKPSFGLGQYFRGQHELCLFGTKGKAMVPDYRKLSSVLEAPKSGHSKKPEAFYRDVELISPGPYLEMFAREQRDGWDCWGPHSGLFPVKATETGK